MNALARKYAPWVAIALACVIPAFFFWVAYDSVGVKPWNYGLLGAPESGTDTPSRGQLLVGLAWMFLVMPALLAVLEIVRAVLARWDMDFTSAGHVCCILAIAIPTTWAATDSMGKISTVGHAMRAHYAEYKLKREILVLKGESDKVQILDANFVQEARDKGSR